jgi:hypothetical protein
VIAENMWAQVDLDGNQYLLLDSITDHRTTSEAVSVDESFMVKDGMKYPRKTTKGWEMCIQWKDGTTTWERLADLKESNPVEVAEYAVSRSIEDQPAFNWWVPYILKKRNRIIAAVSNRYLKRTHKFGVRIPRTVRECRELDKENGNTMWQDAIQKEMNNVTVAFKMLDKGEEVPPAYKYIDCHMIFDVKMENFRQKARLVAGDT